MNSGRNSTYFYAIFATTIVLMVLGVVAFIAYEARITTAQLREEMVAEVVLRDDVSTEEANQMKSELSKKEFVKSIRFVSKEEAGESLKKELGEDYLDILGFNPLYPSFRVNLHESFANNAGFEKLQQAVSADTLVQQVNFQKNIANQLDSTLRTVTFFGLIIGTIFLAFAISLIFSSIKLAIFSRRQLVKTMQLFGATRWFISKPFLGRSIVNGIISGLLASLTLFAAGFYLNYEFPMLQLTRNLPIFALLSALLMVFGILISFFSTLIALTRYLNYRLTDFN
ncbi:MAG: permease-like cell division protein FtsX [Chitinophagales bacterium]